MKNHIIFFSGGKSSFTVADFVKTHYPNDNIVLYFTDTNWEDEDLYRFINEAADKLELPLLTHSMGLTPIELMFKQKVVFNSRIGNCSKILKMKVSADFIKKGKKPQVEEWRNKQYLKQEDFTTDAVLYFGIGWDEMHREGAIKKNWQPYQVEMPLIEHMIDNSEILVKYNIKQPRLYDLGFVHNNCMGRCVKAGQGHFRNLKEKMPDVFQELMEQEHYMKLYVSAYHYIKNLDELESDAKEMYLEQLDQCYEPYFKGKAKRPKPFIEPNLHLKQYAFMKKSKDNETNPYPIRDLYYDMQEEGQQIDLFDIGGCGCFVDYS